jgi:tetratricopeptide (TPR) repeat protein
VLRDLLRHLLQRAWRSPPTASASDSPAALRQAFEAFLAVDDYAGARELAAAAGRRMPYESQLLLGRAHQKLHEPAPALRHFEAARQLRDGDPELYDFRGAMFQEMGRPDEALADYARALALRPDFPLASYHLAMARLLTGDFARGWDGYELRRLSADAAPSAAGLPRWEGEPLAGRRLLITGEQGLGDEIMFASILPQLLAAGTRCCVQCEPRLAALFRRSFPDVAVFAAGAPCPEPADVAIEAGSLPRLFRRAIADFPRHAGYLRADPGAVARWRARLDTLGPGLKVGLAWTGGVRRTRRELRSIPLAQLLPVLRVPGVQFVSLQYTADAAAETAALRSSHGIDVHHWPEALDDYDQTAALVCALDQVVSVCTSLVHLTGALGRPAWVMAPAGPEWRYGAAGETMPWYPSVRLFRQAAYAEWDPVVLRVAGELAALRRNDASSRTTAPSA